MKERNILNAGEGKIFTNGEIYGKQIFLADGLSSDDFYEITDAQYREITEAESLETTEKQGLSEAERQAENKALKDSCDEYSEV